MNDDAKTYSTTYSEIRAKSTMWGKVLPNMLPNVPYIAVVNSTNRRMTAHTGVLVYDPLSSAVLFIPVLIIEFQFLYKVYSENTSFNFLHIGTTFEVPAKIMNTLYFQLKVPCAFL
jgi:hypothetical protein